SSDVCSSDLNETAFACNGFHNTARINNFAGLGRTIYRCHLCATAQQRFKDVGLISKQQCAGGVILRPQYTYQQYQSAHQNEQQHTPEPKADQLRLECEQEIFNKRRIHESSPDDMGCITTVRMSARVP